MEELMNAIREKTGLPADQAQGAAEAALDFLKDKLPGGIGDKLEGLLEGNADEIADSVGDLADKGKGMLGL